MNPNEQRLQLNIDRKVEKFLEEKDQITEQKNYGGCK